MVTPQFVRVTVFLEMHMTIYERCGTACMMVAMGIFLQSIEYSAAEDNLIVNPSVETGAGAYPDGWSREKSGNNISVFNNHTQGQDGERALQIVVTQYVAGYSGWFFNPIDADPGKSYRYSEYYKATMPTKLFVRVTNKSGQTSTALLADVPASSEWKKLDTEFSVSDDAKSLTVVHRTQSLVTLLTDNFSLVKKDGSAPSVPVDTVPPSVVVTAPASGAALSGTQTISANASDAVGVAGVQFLVDGEAFGTEDVSSPYSVSLDTKTLSDGAHTVSARARDAAGNAATSAPVSFLVNNTPASPPSASTENIVPNLSLETVSPANTNLPLSWKKTKTGNNNASFTYLKTGYSGSRSLQVKISRFTSGVAYYSFDAQPVVSGKTYEFSMKYKSDTYTECDAAVTLADGTVQYEYLGVVYPSPSGWSTFRTRLTLPDTAKSATVYTLLYSAGSLVTDDYSLSRVTIVPFSEAVVTLTFDEFTSSLYENVYPLFKKYGMVGTMYLVSSELGQPGMMTSTELHNFQNSGFEIGSHTVSHPHLPLLSSDEVDAELRNSQSVISQYMGTPVESFASPYGEYTDQVLEQIKQFYSSHRSVDVGYNTKDNFDPYNIKAMSPISSTSPETVLGWVDEAIRNRAWLSIVYHDIVDGGPTFSNTSAHLETVLAGLQARGVRVLTNRAALSEVLAQMQ